MITAATVTVINTGTGIHYQGLTNETGEYYVSNLPPGRYRIEVEKLGFKAVIQSGVMLHVQDAVEVNFEMMLGSASESVTVAGESSPLDTESSTVGTVVEQRKANELPLNGRNVFNLIVLAPSVIPQGSSTGTPVGVNPFGWNNYQVSGSFGNQSAEYLDGQPLNIGYINSARADPNAGLDPGVQSSDQQSGRGVGPLCRWSHQPEHEGWHELPSRRGLRVSAQSHLQCERLLSERRGKTATALGAESVRA